MLVADVVAEESRHGTHGAWMVVRFVEWAIKGYFTGVETDACPGLAETGALIFFAGHEIDCAGLCFVRQDEIHQRVFWRFLPRSCNFIERFPGEVLELRVFGRGDENPRSAAAIIEEVFPVGVIA